MSGKEGTSKNGAPRLVSQSENLLKSIIKVIIPMALLAGGIAVLALSLPGWSIILGIPMVIFGVVFLLYTYDEIVTTHFFSPPGRIVKCSVCGRPTPLDRGQDEEDAICVSCKIDIEKGLTNYEKK